MPLTLTSSAFSAGAEIPERHLGRPTKAALLKAMEGHVLAKAELVGTYQKQQ